MTEANKGVKRACTREPLKKVFKKKKKGKETSSDLNAAESYNIIR